jgi:hypothetical protein
MHVVFCIVASMRFLIVLFIGVGMYELNVWQLVLHFTDHIELVEDGHKNTHRCLLAEVEKSGVSLVTRIKKRSITYFAVVFFLND